MTTASRPDPTSAQVCDDTGLLAPLRVGAFRSIWTANLFSNLGTWAQSVAAAWVITASHGGPLLVALIQAAAAAPLVLLSVVAGVLADNHDRRRIMLFGLALEMIGALLLTVLAFLHRLEPSILIGAVLWISFGAAITVPAWQAAVGEQVPRPLLGSAVLLNSVNFNVARAAGPALGGLVLSAFGAPWVFALNVLAYAGLLFALWRWHRPVPVRALPPERVREGVIAAVRFTRHSTVTRRVMLRSFLFGLASSVIWALLPLLAYRYAEGARLYGYMLGALGIGSIAGSFAVPALRRLLGMSRLISCAGAVLALGTLSLGLMRALPVTLPVLVLIGGCWVAAVSQYNAAVQLLVPDWVKGRALALYQTALYGGLTLGSFLWGHLAETLGVDGALLCAGLLLLAFVILLYGSRLPDADDAGIRAVRVRSSPPEMVPFNERVGGVLVMVEYRIPEQHLRAFLGAAPALRRLRRRNGAGRWGLFRDVEDERLWREVFGVENWLQHLRMLDRMTLADKALLDDVASLHEGGDGPLVRRAVSYEALRGIAGDLRGLG